MSLFLLACIAFISLGLPDAVLGVAWPGLRDTFALPQSAMGAVLAAISVGYMSSSFATGWVAPRLGIGRLLPLSTALVTVGAFGVALADSFWLVLAAGVLGGLGSGAIDSGLNAYAAAHFSARRMNWLHAAWGLGAALGPFILAAVFAAGAGYRLGYASVGAALGLLTLLFVLTAGRWQNGAPAQSGAPPRGPTLLSPRALLHVLAFFIYTGVELGVGQWSFTLLTEQRGIAADVAGIWTAVYWTSLCAGRVLVGVVADRIGPPTLVAVGVGAMLAGALVFAIAPMPLAGLGLVLTGLGAAPVFPMLMTHTARVFEARTAARLVGAQVSAAMLGAVAVPTLAGMVADLGALDLVAPLLATLAALLALICWPILKGAPVTTNPTTQER